MNQRIDTPTIPHANSASDAAARDYAAALRDVELATHEDIFETLTLWLRAPNKSRELKVDATRLGLSAKLYESGMLQATGRGSSSDDAIAHALQDVLARESLPDPDEAENQWNARNGGGR